MGLMRAVCRPDLLSAAFGSDGGCRLVGVAATSAGTILAAIALSGGCFATMASAAAPSTQDIQAVWEREAAYWNDQKLGDIGHYVALFHDGFVGWPCSADAAGQLPPAAQLGLKQPTETLDVALDEKAVTGTSAVVETYYRATTRLTAGDGSTRARVRYFTHVWVREAGSWKIMGGMCREATPH
jgi:Domain of unknown function (DUF4440)